MGKRLNNFFRLYHVKPKTKTARLCYFVAGFGEIADGLVRVLTLGVYSTGMGLFFGEKALRAEAVARRKARDEKQAQ